jgi:hypothetical protein
MSVFLIYTTENDSKILIVVYGRETWSVSLREDHRLRVFKNRVLRGEYFDFKGKDVPRCRGKFHNDELHRTVIKSRRMRWAGHAALRR